jgi:flagellar hook-length control protein FliK
MTPTNLPVQPAVPTTPTPAPAAVPTAVAVEQSQTTDFLLMLGQLVSAGIPPAAGAGVATTSKLPLVSAADEPAKKDEIDPEALLAMFSIAVPPPSTINIDVPVDVPAEVAMHSMPVVSSESGTAQNPLATVLQGVAREATDAQLFTEVVDDLAVAATATATATSTSTSIATSIATTGAGATAEAATVGATTVTASDATGQPVDGFHLQTVLAELQQQTRTFTAHEAVTRPVHVPVGNAAWADEIGSRLVVMTESGNHTASLKLSPEHLGPLEISIVVRDDKTSVWFGAAHADTRAAIETALPRLREMFQAQGLSLADAGVFREPPREQGVPKASITSGERGNGSDETTTTVSGRTRIGLVDAYA